MQSILILFLTIFALVIIRFSEKNRWQPQQPQLPVFIGSNGYAINDEVVNRYFKGLEKYFSIYFFEYADNPTQNRIVYVFRAYEVLNPDLPHRRLLSLCRKVGEQALSKHMHEHGVYTQIDNFVAVTFEADRLYYHIACNEMGFAEIAELRKL
ncbi:MAG: hypothetical protein NC393_13325 [Clostridium sp.]|nr:hypothetical protein [Clostridium sp.]MCM1173092.1 hypothetical protein [Clostridium sp.]MCM1208091.1 hypothetical protein [Ruminococcus sp.]